MDSMKMILILLLVKTAYSFTCPDGTQTFYHADVSTRCTVYHICANSQMQTLSCPPGKAFNYRTSMCEEASTVECIERLDQHNRKQAVEEIRPDDDQSVISEQTTQPPVTTSRTEGSIASILKQLKKECSADMMTIKKNLEIPDDNEIWPFLERIFHNRCFVEKVMGRSSSRSSSWLEDLVRNDFTDVRDQKRATTMRRSLRAFLLQRPRSKREIASDGMTTPASKTPMGISYVITPSLMAVLLRNDHTDLLNQNRALRLRRYLRAAILQHSRPKRNTDNANMMMPDLEKIVGISYTPSSLLVADLLRNDYTNMEDQKLWRYFKTSSLQRLRPKRNVDDNDRVIPDCILAVVGPILRDITSKMNSTSAFQEKSLSDTVILPIYREMLKNRETVSDFFHLCMSSQTVVLPILRFLRHMDYSRIASDVSVLRGLIKSARFKFRTEIIPVVENVFERHHALILKNASENADLIEDIVKNMNETESSFTDISSDVLKEIINFHGKHGVVLKNSVETPVQSKFVSLFYILFTPVTFILCYTAVKLYKERKHRKLVEVSLKELREKYKQKIKRLASEKSGQQDKLVTIL